MKKYILPIIAVLFLFLAAMIPTAKAQLNDPLAPSDAQFQTGQPPQPTDAQVPNYPPDEYYRGKVLEILEDSTVKLGDSFSQPYQKVKVEIITGAEKGHVYDMEYGTGATLQESQKLKVGDVVLVTKVTDASGTQYLISDKYRLNSVLYLLLGFMAIVVIFGRKKGVGALLGLAMTVLILAKFIIPRILSGANPLFTIIVGSLAILLLSLYMAHGVNKRTSIALASTVLTLGLSILMAFFAVNIAKLTGLGSEDAFYLQFGNLENLNLKWLLLGGIIVGTLGVLDDITTGQTAVVAELKSANRELGFGELYKRGLVVGREHIASLVNTLVLAYAGASFPLLLLFSQNNKFPLWFSLNGEFFIEEVIRTLVGSAALILAVPITTAIAAYFWSKKAPDASEAGHIHVH